MDKKFAFGVFVVAVVLAFVGGYSSHTTPQTGGSQAPNYAVAGDPNYAVAVYSTTTPGFTLGNLTQTSSTKLITVPFPRGKSIGLAGGDTCGVQFSGATSTTGWSGDAQITSITNSTSTVTVTFFSGATSTNTTVATGTLTLTCQHY